MPTFDDMTILGKEKLFKTFWEEDKMLVHEIFSFSHRDFYLVTDKFNVLSLISNLSSANSFKLDNAKILSSDKRHIPKYQNTKTPHTSAFEGHVKSVVHNFADKRWSGNYQDQQAILSTTCPEQHNVEGGNDGKIVLQNE